MNGAYLNIYLWIFYSSLIQHPYPTEDEKKQIAGQTNLTLLQVNNWLVFLWVIYFHRMNFYFVRISMRLAFFVYNKSYEQNTFQKITAVTHVVIYFKIKVQQDLEERGKKYDFYCVMKYDKRLGSCKITLHY